MSAKEIAIDDGSKKHDDTPDGLTHVNPIDIEDLIDLEEWAKAGKKPKPAKTYRIRIDKEKRTSPFRR